MVPLSSTIEEGTNANMGLRELEELAADLDAAVVDPAERLGTRSNALVLREVLFHDEHRYWQFTPTQAARDTFVERLTQWLQNTGVTSSDAAILLRLVPELQFVDRDDMLTLYRAAFEDQVRRWIIDILGLTFSLPENELRDTISSAVDNTWFCPVTDSFDIAQFHHANGLASKDHRPPWRILKQFGDVDKIREYMHAEGLQRLVLLEDFVGSGTQVSGPLSWAATMFGVDILFVPLIITEDGLTRVNEIATKNSSVRVAPVFTIPRHVQVREVGAPDGDSFEELRRIVVSTFDSVREPMAPEISRLTEPFGFRGLGTLLVMHTNCPNNTLPLIWHDAPEWRALFPRVSRA
jgi:hypothetical protein